MPGPAPPLRESTGWEKKGAPLVNYYEVAAKLGRRLGTEVIEGRILEQVQLLEWIRKDPKIHQQTHDKLLAIAREAANEELDAIFPGFVFPGLLPWMAATCE